MCEEYNGWTNRETWATALHINNDEGLYRTVQDWASTKWEEHTNIGQESISWGEIAESESEAVTGLAESIEDFVTELLDSDWDGVKSMRYDIGSLWRVNWREIADSFISEMAVK
jgi:hypothetical protein